MTTTFVRGGADWSDLRLTEIWGDVTEEEAEEMSEMVVNRFKDIAQKAGSTASWIPQTSEILIDIDEPEKFIDQFDEWKEQAETKIFEAFCNGEFERA